MTPNINEIKDALELQHRCRAEHVQSELVIETAAGGDAWRVTVEVFELVGSAEAKCCYGWMYMAGGIRRRATVLQVAPVTSPKLAVRAWLAKTEQAGK